MEDTTLKEFTEALGAEFVVDLGRKGPLSLPEALAVRDWYDERQRVLRENPAS